MCYFSMVAKLQVPATREGVASKVKQFTVYTGICFSRGSQHSHMFRNYFRSVLQAPSVLVEEALGRAWNSVASAWLQVRIRASYAVSAYQFL